MNEISIRAGAIMAQHGEALDALVRINLYTHETRQGSKAALFEAQEADSGVSRNHRLRANHDIKHNMLSAADYIFASGRLLEAGPLSGYALGATARGAVEALARAVFLMKADDVKDQFFRWSTTFMRSLSYANRLQYSASDQQHWAKLNKAQYDETKKTRDAAGGASAYTEKAVTPPALVEKFLSEVMPERSRWWYGRVSAMSHTERSSIEILKDPDMQPAHSLNIAFADMSNLDYGDVLGAVIWAEREAMKHFVQYFGLFEPEVSDWLASEAVLNDYFETHHSSPG
jgi:hypothetical protein